MSELKQQNIQNMLATLDDGQIKYLAEQVKAAVRATTGETTQGLVAMFMSSADDNGELCQQWVELTRDNCPSTTVTPGYINPPESATAFEVPVAAAPVETAAQTRSRDPRHKELSAFLKKDSRMKTAGCRHVIKVDTLPAMTEEYAAIRTDLCGGGKGGNMNALVKVVLDEYAARGHGKTDAELLLSRAWVPPTPVSPAVPADIAQHAPATPPHPTAPQHPAPPPQQKAPEPATITVRAEDFLLALPVQPDAPMPWQPVADVTDEEAYQLNLAGGCLTLTDDGHYYNITPGGRGQRDAIPGQRAAVVVPPHPAQSAPPPPLQAIPQVQATQTAAPQAPVAPPHPVQAAPVPAAPPHPQGAPAPHPAPTCGPRMVFVGCFPVQGGHKLGQGMTLNDVLIDVAYGGGSSVEAQVCTALNIPTYYAPHKTFRAGAKMVGELLARFGWPAGAGSIFINGSEDCTAEALVAFASMGAVVVQAIK